MTGLVLALLAAVGPAAPDAARSQYVKLHWDAQTKGCAAQVNGLDLGDPETEAGKAALLRALPDKETRVQVRGIDGLPYHCVQGVTDALQEGGYRGVSLGSPSPVTRR